MKHIQRKVIARNGSTHRVLEQGNGVYTISINRKKVRVKVDPYSGSVQRVE